MAEIKVELRRYLGSGQSDVPDFVPDLMGDDFGPKFGSHPLILSAVTAALGSDVLLWACGLFGKPARVGKETPWHQDGHYWPITPLDTCTVWLALDRSDIENGALTYVPGSHRARELYVHDHAPSAGRTLSNSLDLTDAQRASARTASLEPGQFSVHDVYLVHGSAANTSSRRRAGITFRYMPAAAYYDRDLARRQHAELGVPDISGRTLYLVSGEPTESRNDVVPIDGWW
jgi:ectoine hydroxylase-related dioxygenase (phytanoyl-CoA dioxygenase family)